MFCINSDMEVNQKDSFSQKRIPLSNTTPYPIFPDSCSDLFSSPPFKSNHPLLFTFLFFIFQKTLSSNSPRNRVYWSGSLCFPPGAPPSCQHPLILIGSSTEERTTKSLFSHCWLWSPALGGLLSEPAWSILCPGVGISASSEPVSNPLFCSLPLLGPFSCPLPILRSLLSRLSYFLPT